MSPELIYLGYYGIIVIVTLLIQVLAAMLQVGLPALAGNREGLVLTGMAFRLDRAAANSLFAMALMAPAVLMLHLTQPGLALTGHAMLVFLLARIGYVVLYTLGVAWLRTAAWLLGFGCTALLYVSALWG
jgi:uncharacterized MAPEG superfamily protein